MNKQDWYLNKLDITQYVLRHSHVIKGEAKVHIADNIRLIVVIKSPPKETIFKDILNAINITDEDCLILSPAKRLMPIQQLKQVIWFIDEPLPEEWQQAEITHQPIIQTASLAELASSPAQKRQLWQALCQYENYFKHININ